MNHVRQSTSWVAALCIVFAAGVQAADAPAEYSVSVEPRGPVRYHGLVDRDDAGLTSQALTYDAGALGLPGVLALIAMHGAAIDQRLLQQSRRLKEISDGIALPHNEALAGLSAGDLVRGLAQAPSDGAPRPWRIAKDATRVRSRPAFGVSEDATTLVIENLVQIGAGASSPPTFSVTVRVVRDHEQPGSPIADRVAASLAATAASGVAAAASGVAAAASGVAAAAPVDPAYAARLQRATQDLFAESIDLALRDAMHEFAGREEAARTYRYTQGGALKIERGQKIAATCDRLILRNLYGGITSLPLPEADKADGVDCPRAASPGR